MQTAMVAEEIVVSTLDDSDYLRQRYEPRPGDIFYLHLKDLLGALSRFKTAERLRILDYGCGGSPYRRLFPNSTYHRADFIRMPDMDFTVSADGRLPEVPSAQYDLVLSTQVLEHVGDPMIYLAEASRVLKPGGRLLLSTHGVFPDHGCPFDYWRWTADGLRLSLEGSGFEVDQVYRLTCGVRAVAFCVGQAFRALPPTKPLLYAFIVRTIRWLYKKGVGLITRIVDDRTQHLAEMTEHTDGHVDFSIGLMAVARKPSEPA